MKTVTVQDTTMLQELALAHPVGFMFGLAVCCMIVAYKLKDWI